MQKNSAAAHLRVYDASSGEVQMYSGILLSFGLSSLVKSFVLKDSTHGGEEIDSLKSLDSKQEQLSLPVHSVSPLVHHPPLYIKFAGR